MGCKVLASKSKVYDLQPTAYNPSSCTAKHTLSWQAGSLRDNFCLKVSADQICMKLFIDKTAISLYALLKSNDRTFCADLHSFIQTGCINLQHEKSINVKNIFFKFFSNMLPVRWYVRLIRGFRQIAINLPQSHF